MKSYSSNDFKITVIIPAYNSEQFITNAINSALTQTFRPHEIIVIDDSSKDNTVAIVKKSFGSSVKLLTNHENRGAAATRNIGIKAASGNWIAFLDSDDEWMPNHLESLFHIIQKYALKWACGQHQNIRDGKVIPRPHSKWKDFHKEDAYFENFFEAWGHEAPIITSGMLINKNSALIAGLFNETLTVAEDIDFWFKIAYITPKFGLSKNPTVQHYLRTHSLSTSDVNRAELFLELLQQHTKFSSKKHLTSTLFLPSARKIVRWIIEYAIKSNNRDVLKKIFYNYPAIIGNDFMLLRWIYSLPAGLKLFRYLHFCKLKTIALLHKHNG